LENAARRAVSAALAIQRAVVEARRPGPAVRTVVHTEQTTVGHVAGNLLMEEEQRTALIEVLNQLLERVAAGEVYVTAKTAPFLERHFELRGLESSPGSADPLFTVVRPDPNGPRLW